MRNLIFTAILTFTAVGLATGCSEDSEKKSESYSYDYTVNGCATGKHTFGSLADYCRGLADDNRNNGCASGLRCQTFNDRCQSLNLNVTCF